MTEASRPATRHSRETGFSFLLFPKELPGRVLARKGAQGRDTPISGTIGLPWAINLWEADHFWRDIAQQPESIVAVNKKLRYLSVFENSKKNFWVVWEVPASAPLSRASIDERAKVVATCHRKDETIECSRRIVADTFHIRYEFDPANLRAIRELDSAVSRTVLSWQCKD